MATRGHHVDLVCPKPVLPYTPVPQKGLDIDYTPRLEDPFFVGKPMAVMPFGLGELLRVFRKRRIDVVHIQEPGSLGIMALILAKLYRVPVVGAMHFSLEQILRVVPPVLRPFSGPFMTLYIRMIYPRYTAIMMPTVTVTHDLAAIIGHPERIHAISNGVETDVFVPGKGTRTALRRKYGLDERAVYFLYIGRLDADKNLETVLRALALVPDPIRLVIAGVGKQKEQLRALARALSLDSRVVWLDKVDRGQMIELYQVSDAFVIMSPVETQSIVALQAISCGLPLLAAQAGALPELVRDGVSGYLIHTYDVPALARRFTELSRNPKLRERMGKESRKISLAHEKNHVLKNLETLYESVILAYGKDQIPATGSPLPGASASD